MDYFAPLLFFKYVYYHLCIVWYCHLYLDTWNTWVLPPTLIIMHEHLWRDKQTTWRNLSVCMLMLITVSKHKSELPIPDSYSFPWWRIYQLSPDEMTDAEDAGTQTEAIDQTSFICISYSRLLLTNWVSEITKKHCEGAFKLWLNDNKIHNPNINVEDVRRSDSVCGELSYQNEQ